MTMKDDLISRRALLEELNDDKYTWEDYDAVDFALQAIPAVDAVEVVRCKDCKHSELYFFADNGTTRTEQYKCIHPRMGVNVLEPDDFCRYGDRRADDAD